MPKLEALADEGGPARPLSCAPDHLRCRSVVPDPDGGSPARCSRFTIKLPGGCRDQFCISHSRTEHAEQSRGKAARAQEELLEAERQRRREFAHNLVPSVWTSREDFQSSRLFLAHALAEGTITSADAHELRGIINDAERHAQTGACEWSPEYRGDDDD
jgi:hypothetical protein